jgi:hypothetical protein
VEDKVQELVNYCRILYRRQPEWMRYGRALARMQFEVGAMKASSDFGLKTGIEQA